jgi:fermentation-respiration switch protein FrsA (DUF1100 family)
LAIVGREAVASWMGVEAFQEARGPKVSLWTDGAAHNDLYDEGACVTPVVKGLSGFFSARLAPDAER